MEPLISKDLDLLSSEDILDILNVIHAATGDLRLSEMRSGVAQALQNAFDASGVAFLLGDKEFKTIDNADIIGVGVDYSYLDRWIGNYCRHDPFQHESHPDIPVCKVDDILPYGKWVKTKIYNEFYRPQRIHYKLSISLSAEGKVLGLIGLFRPNGSEDFSAKDVTKARILVPYLATALDNISRVVYVAGSPEDPRCSAEKLQDRFRLTRREIDIAHWVSKGLTNDEIGKKLYISRFTVETHLKNIFDKVKVKRRTELAGLFQSV